MNRITIITGFFYFFFSTTMMAQPAPIQEDTTKQKKEKQTTIKRAAIAKDDPAEIAYQKRIRKSRIDGVYIPKDLYDTFTQFDRLMGPETQQQFKVLPEEQAGKKFHLIMWICNNWGLYEGSRLSHYLREMGISHPEAQAHFLITAYHRKLNKKDLGLKETVQFYKEKNEAKKKKELENETILFEEKRKRGG